MRSTVLRFAFGASLLTGAGSCGSGSSVDESSASSICESGRSRACACNASLSQTCTSGQWSSCACAGEPSSSGGGSSASSDGGLAGSVSNDAGGSAASGALPCAVQTLLRSGCGACHGRDNQYPAPMKLETWDDLHAAAPSDPSRKVYEMMLARVQDTTRPMPPTQFAAPLSAEQIATLKTWVDSGAPPAQASDACGPSEAESDGGSSEPQRPSVDSSGSPDDCEEYFELRAHAEQGEADTPFQVPAGQGEGANRYQCFYFSPEYAPDSQGLWFKSLIDNQKIMHHWLLYASDLDAVHAPGSQSPCTAAEPGAYLIAGWAPGAPDYSPPPDVGLSLPNGPDARLILEIHWFNESGSAQPDRSGVRFCTAKKDTRPHTAGVHFTGSEGICIQPQSQKDVVGMCDPDDGQDIHLMRVWPHMHTLGRRMKVTLLRADGTREVLHDKPFDFYNQQAYDLNDVVMRAGDRLETVCSFDNRTNKAVPFGEDTQDEMCFGFITAWPAGALVNGLLDVGSWIGGPLQPARRCLNPLAIFDSCNGLADYPAPGG